MHTRLKARQLSQGGTPEHFRFDFLHAKHAVDTRFFHELVGDAWLP